MRTLVVLTLSSICMFILFSVRPVRLASPLRTYADTPGQYPITSGALDFVKAEYEKAVEEIKVRIEIEDNWYHYKFLLIGGLIVFLLGWGRAVRDLSTDPFRFEDPEINCSICAVACVIAVAIDIHIRNNTIVTQQLGLWIANYVEPAFLQTPFLSKGATGFIPYEQFLRIQLPGTTGMHADDLYSLAFWPHLHFLTWVIYILYLFLFHRAIRLASVTRRKVFLLAGFALVAMSFAAFTWVAHSGPEYLEFKIVPWVDWWARGWVCPFSYLLIWCCMMLVNLYSYGREICDALLHP
jgi:hypothetical protein